MTDTTSIVLLNLVLLLLFTVSIYNVISICIFIKGRQSYGSCKKAFKAVTLPLGIDPGLSEGWLFNKRCQIGRNLEPPHPRWDECGLC